MSPSQDYARYKMRSFFDIFATMPLRARPRPRGRLPYSDDISFSTLRLSIINHLETYSTHTVQSTFSESQHSAGMAPAFLSNFIPRSAMADYIELKHDEWNNVVDDETQCMVITQEEEIRCLSRRNKNRTVLSNYSGLGPKSSQQQWRSISNYTRRWLMSSWYLPASKNESHVATNACYLAKGLFRRRTACSTMLTPTRRS